MPTEAAREAADRARRALDRLGFKHASTKELGTSMAIDYTIDSPDPTEVPRQVSSSLIISREGLPSTFIMRFPVVDVNPNSPHEEVDVWRALSRTIEEHDVAAEPYVEGGAMRVNPHIDSIHADDDEVGALLPDDPVGVVQKLADMRDTFYEVLSDG